MRPLRAAFDSLFAFLEDCKENYVWEPNVIFQQEVLDRLGFMRRMLNEVRLETEGPIAHQFRLPQELHRFILPIQNKSKYSRRRC